MGRFVSSPAFTIPMRYVINKTGIVPVLRAEEGGTFPGSSTPPNQRRGNFRGGDAGTLTSEADGGTVIGHQTPRSPQGVEGTRCPINLGARRHQLKANSFAKRSGRSFEPLREGTFEERSEPGPGRFRMRFSGYGVRVNRARRAGAPA